MSKLTGTVKWYDRVNKFGFIITESIKKDIHIKESNLGNIDPRYLQPGVEVEFTVVVVKKGYEAKNITILTPKDSIAIPDKDRLKLEDLFNKKVVNIEVDTEVESEDEDGIFVKALIFEGNIRVPLFVEDDGVFLSLEPDEEDEN